MNPNQSTTAELQTVQPELTCPLCGNADITTSWKPDAFDYGTVELTVDVPVRRCDACDFDYLDDEAERLKHAAICRHLGVLSPDEIRRIRTKLDMTRAEFASITGIGEASLNRWENGLNIQTPAYDRYLRLLVAHPGNIRDLENFSNLIAAQRSKVPLGKRFRVLDLTQSILLEASKSFRLLPKAA